MVEVSNKHKSITVSVSSNNGNTVVAASSDTSQYWANQSHNFADQSKELVQEAKDWANKLGGVVDGTEYSAKHYAELANSYVEGFENVVINNTNNIITISNDCLNQINTTKEEAVENVNSAKTTIINDIEFIADGEKKEIEDLIDTGKDELKEAIGDVKVLTTLEIGDIGIAPLGIDETQGKRRYLNGQLIIQEQYVQFTNKVQSAIELYPSLACTEEEWQTTATMTVGGQVGKFVVDDKAGTIRLPKIIMPIQGLTDLSKLGEIVEAGLPNITSGDGTLENSIDIPLWTNTPQEAGAIKTYSGGRKYTTGSGSSNVGYMTFDASRSNPIYGNSDTVQQEQIQYPYFIQVATGAETEDNIINEIELNNPFSLLDYKFSEYELNNLSWLRSNGQYNSKVVYPAVYDLLLKIYNGTKTKTGVSVKLTTETYTDYDFVLNTAEETFRLPISVTNSAQGYLYFYVGETVQNANLINAGRIEEKIASLIPNNSNLIATFGIPDYSSGVVVTSGYVAEFPCFVFAITSSGTGIYGLGLNINGIQIDNTTVGGTATKQFAVTGYASKGDVISLTSNSNSATITVFPLKGVN